MSRIIKTDSAGKQRSQLTKAMAVALRQLAAQADLNEESRDLAAFIALALQSIHAGIDPSVEAWEKRGYWVKADRFRMEWDWTGPMSARMADAVRRDDRAVLAELCMKTAQKLGGLRLTGASRVGKPWLGAYSRLQVDWSD